ncbi:vesicular glutamate transporter 3-like isoform X2 [Planococcus citri]
MFLCYINVAFIRCNISIAVVEMASSKEILTNNSIKIQPAEFNWDSKTVGFVLSAFYYGGLMSVFGGYIVTKLGGAMGCSSSLMLSGIIIVLHPASLYYDFSLFLVLRVLTGLSESFMMVSVAQVCSKWVPQNEKSKLMSLVVSGVTLGVGVVHGFCAFLTHQWGWQMIFYVTGSISLITSLLCFIFVRNEPSEDRCISKKELAYIQEGTTTITSKEKMAHPYRRILLSAPVWALICGQFALTWVWTITSTLLPLYVKDITQGDTNKVGLISSVPNLVNIFTLPICGILLDYIKNFDISITKIHKVSLSGAFIISSILFVIIVLISNLIVSIMSFILIQMSISVINLILQIIAISIAPNSSSIVAGLGIFGSTLGGILARNATGFMTMKHSLEEWNQCFILASGISFLGGIMIALFGSSEAQPWSFSSTIKGKQSKSACNSMEK